MSAATASLNAETSRPQERAEHHLPSKPCADAVVEHTSEDNEIKNAADIALADHGGNASSLNAETAQPQERAAHHLPPKSYADAVADSTSEDAETGKPADTRLNGHLENNSSLMSNADKTNGFPATKKETSGLNNGNKVVYGNHVDDRGNHLASVKTAESSLNGVEHSRGSSQKKPRSTQISLKNDPERKQEKAQLASGRRAGAGWERSAIRWAPLNVPVQRRLQTLVVLWHTMCIPIFLSLFFLLCAMPLAWPILIPYLIFTFVFSNEASSGTLARRSEYLRRSKIWSLFGSYFPARLHRTVELTPTRKYIFGYHPHGIISHGAFAAFGTEALGFSDLYPGITNTLLTLDTNFRIPLYRDYALAMGLASVSKESIENLLSVGGLNGAGMGRAVTVVVGGARESLDAKPNSLKLVLRSRKGFVKIAIRMGADLVPTLAFGENELYDQVNSEEHPWVHKAQMVLKKMMGFTIPLFHARGVFNYDVGLMPYRTPLNVVVGRPIQVVQQGSGDGAVDPKYLDEVHEKYVTELLRLWDSHKDTFAKHRDYELEILD